MKICWDNLEKLRYNNKTGYWYESQPRYTSSGRSYYLRFEYIDKCDYCKEPFLMHKQGKGFCSMSCAKKSWKMPLYVKKIISAKALKRYKNPECHPNWKGGIKENNIPFYDTYAHKISYCEEVRRNKNNLNILEVKCAYCGKWYVPKMTDVCERIRALEGKCTKGSEYRLYCSIQCKQECPIYRQVLYPKGFKPATSREVQPELRQMCFHRDYFTCQKCGKTQDELDVGLHCHHIEGIRWEPIESADLDKVITFCKTCHINVHKQPDCGYQDMRCK